jgi:hypothetical protein
MATIFQLNEPVISYFAISHKLGLAASQAENASSILVARSK